MEGKNPFWNAFMRSGKVEDYIRFREQRRERKENPIAR
jgi:hypothetical protein